MQSSSAHRKCLWLSTKWKLLDWLLSSVLPVTPPSTSWILLVNKVLYHSMFGALSFRKDTEESIEKIWMLSNIYIHEMRPNLSSLCTSSLESRSWCSWDAKPFQALRQAMRASAWECECSIPTIILLCWRQQLILPFSISITLSFSSVFNIAAPLHPEARTLLAAQMVQRWCPFSCACNIQTCKGIYCRTVCVFVCNRSEVSIFLIMLVTFSYFPAFDM